MPEQPEPNDESKKIVIGSYVPEPDEDWDWDALMTQDSAWGPARKAMRDAARRQQAETENLGDKDNA